MVPESTMKSNSSRPTLPLSRALLGLLAGLTIALVLGFLEKQQNLPIPSYVLEMIQFPGFVFLSCLQLAMVPLVLASIALGVSKMKDSGSVFQLSLRAFVYFTFTTLVAVSLGILLTLLIEPGSSRGIALSSISMEPKTLSLFASLREIFPNNILKALTEAKMLQILFLGILLGVFLVKAESRYSHPMQSFLESLENFSQWIVGMAIQYSPLALASLLGYSLANLGMQFLEQYLAYVFTVILALFLVLCFYSTILLLVCKTSPWRFFSRVRTVMVLAFSTSSSSSILPVTLETAKKDLQVPESTADFVIPLGATMNMDGTAIYQAIATVFLAELYQVSLSFPDLLMILFTVTTASIGTAATPGAGIVVLGGILQNFGIPLEGIGILLGVDRILDMCRTAVNVTGDLTASLVLAKWWKSP